MYRRGSLVVRSFLDHFIECPSGSLWCPGKDILPIKQREPIFLGTIYCLQRSVHGDEGYGEIFGIRGKTELAHGLAGDVVEKAAESVAGFALVARECLIYCSAIKVVNGHRC